MSLSALLAANPQISDPNIIFTGQIIIIPGGEMPQGHQGQPRPTPRPI